MSLALLLLLAGILVTQMCVVVALMQIDESLTGIVSHLSFIVTLVSSGRKEAKP